MVQKRIETKEVLKTSNEQACESVGVDGDSYFTNCDTIKAQKQRNKTLLKSDSNFNGIKDDSDSESESDESDSNESDAEEEKLGKPHVFQSCQDCQNKKFDSEKFRSNLRSCVPDQICDCCNHLLSLTHMSKNVYNEDHEMFNLLKENAGLNPVFVPKDSRKEIHLCIRCEVDLSLKNRNRRIPKCAIANGLFLGDVPEVLQDLTLIEQRCIAPYNCITSIVRVNKGKSGDQFGVIGGVAHVHNDVGKWYRVLPVHPLETLILQVHVADKKDLAEVPKGAQAFKLRPWKVKAALRWLKDNNPLYKDIDIDFTEFDAWVLENSANIEDDTIDVKLKLSVIVKTTDSKLKQQTDKLNTLQVIII
jgi:putative component of toxin-antitoxin plasmid stabilization module